ncbi:hypothetical protein MTO96_020660 [Rhipicephalus appendiculatus]
MEGGGTPEEPPPSAGSQSRPVRRRKRRLTCLTRKDRRLYPNARIRVARQQAMQGTTPKKADVLEEMIDKLAEKTERMFEMLLTRINESDAERNAQHATVNTQLLAVNKRIEDLERREVQLQQPWRADVPPSVTNVPTIVNRGNNANATCPGAEGMHGQACSPNTLA